MTHFANEFSSLTPENRRSSTVHARNNLNPFCRNAKNRRLLRATFFGLGFLQNFVISPPRQNTQRFVTTYAAATTSAATAAMICPSCNLARNIKSCGEERGNSPSEIPLRPLIS